MTEPEPLRDDLSAALAARRDLGPEYEDAVLESFLAKVDRGVQSRIDAAVAEQVERRRSDDRAGGRRLGLGVASLIFGIPITAIATSNSDGLGALVISWAGIAAVNVAHAWSGRVGDGSSGDVRG